MTMTKLEVVALICVFVVFNSKSTWEFGTMQEYVCGNSKYKSFVALATSKDKTYTFFCGGILITFNHVLTTKKCLVQQSKNHIYAFLANNTIKSKVDVITMHQTKPEDRDICLLKLKNSIQASASVEPMCLPTIYKIGSILLGKNVPSAEWQLQDNGMIAVVNTNDVEVTTRHQCETYFNHVNDLLCGKKFKSVPSIGGILFKKMAHTNGDKYVLIGLMVEAKPFRAKKNITAWIDVSYYLEWLLLNIVD